MARMNLLHVKASTIGYGRYGVKLHEAIERAGVDVFDDLPSPRNSDAGNYIPPGSKSAVCSHVSWVSTPGHCRGWWEGQTRSISTMWESSILPEPFREGLDAFDTVIVPSMQNLELFSKYHDNVKFAPLGIDPSEWYPLDRPTKENNDFTFLISGGGKRKGSDLVIDAFRKVFGGAAGVRLLVHSPRTVDIPSEDNIHLIRGFLKAEEERAMYSMAHVYVQPSRGEGFGLRPLQAIAQGIPTIATNAHGHAAFGHLLTYPLGWHLEETPPQSFHHGPAGSWWEPDFDELCQMMESSYENYDRDVDRARTNGWQAVTEFNWDQCAAAYLDAIGRDRLELPDISPVEPVIVDGVSYNTPVQGNWIEPDIRRYLVRVNSHRLFEVGGLQYMLEPGKDYWEVADVKRVLFDSGALDPSCLPQNLDEETDFGLTPEQVQRIPAYTGSHSSCPTCGQKLNTNRPTMEELEALPMPDEN